MDARARTVIVAGGGVSGLLAALVIRRSNPKTRVVLVERERDLGGLYRSFHYDNSPPFDCGTHLIYDTQNNEINQSIQQLLPKEEWVILEGNHKDVAGLYFNGKLQTHSSYIDLRNHPPELQKKCLEDLMAGVNAKEPQTFTNAESYFRFRFGEAITNQFLQPIMMKLYGFKCDELTPFAARLTAMDRVILFNEEKMLELMKTESLRARLAFPNQLTLPNIRAHQQRALYPKKGGMFRFVNAFQAALKSVGVEILLEHQISSILLDKKRIQKVTIQPPKGASTAQLEVSDPGLQVVWACGLPSLAQQLKIPLQFDQLDKRPAGVLVHVLLKKPLKLPPVYYFYVYDQGFSTFRVTNYSSYCPEVLKNDATPLTLEMWPAVGDKSTPEEWIAKATQELKSFGIIDSGKSIISAHAEILKENVPLPTIKNRDWLNRLRGDIRGFTIENVTCIGSAAEEDLFFMHDILVDLYKKIEKLELS